MRNPARIYPLLNKIGDLWVKHPDLRLGQLLYNIQSFGGDVDAHKMYAMEDDELEKLVDSYAKKINRA